MSTETSWKRLVAQALEQTPVSGKPDQPCGLLCLLDYVQRSLAQAGITNRSPFTLYQLVTIWWRTRRDKTRMVQECLNTLYTMQKPSPGFIPGGYLLAVFTLMLAFSLLLPQTASTFRTPTPAQSVLKLKPQPIADIDRLEVRWPDETDYRFAANQFLEQPVLYPRPDGIYDESWLLLQPPGDYALQLVSTSSLDSLIAYCQKHDICSQSAYYRSQLNGKPIYRLLYGRFPSNAAAKKARAALPADLRQLKPWARQFKQIRQELQG